MGTSSLNDIQEFNIDANEDFRGTIWTTLDERKLGMRFHHDKACIRYKDVLVGIHGDFRTYKLVTCLFGRVYAVIVDNRPESIDYLKHKTFILTQDNRKQLLLPPGMGNSFLVLSDVCVYNYKLSYIGEYADCGEQFTLKWNDPALNIRWPIDHPILSPRDNQVLCILKP